MPVSAGPAQHSVAREWNEELLEAIRKDFARPTVHARNLYHVSGAMWDAFAAFDPELDTLIHHESMTAVDIKAAREEALSHAAYGILKWRFSTSPGAGFSLPAFDQLMDELGYDKNFVSTVGNSPAALGNRIAQTYINFGLGDYSNEQNGYENQFYEPVNEPLVPALPGNPDMVDPNRWQPLALDFFEDQAGNVIVGGFPEFLSPEWGVVKPFALQPDDLTIYSRDGHDYWVYHDPGAPPQLGGVGDSLYKAGFEQVVLWSGLLDPSDGVLIDISPASNGDNTLGTNDGNGYELNPVTGLPYSPEVVPAGDYYRVLAEFWADGPDSETPPGHWFTIANYVSDHPLVVKKFRNSGEVLDDLEWDVRLYLAMGGTMHDVAVTVWGMKGWYDYTRPVSAIRYMCDRGQSSDPGGESYHPDGISLYPGSIEVITEETAAPGGRHYPLGGNINEHIGKIAIHAWRGPDYISNPATDTAGVGWIRCEDWWPYQRPSFVTPPFAGYVSGHSAYSRAAAYIMSKFTGSEFFPGGLGIFEAPQNDFLVFEEGPSVDITLQWARYYDAADETSLSRIYGGIHPPADDIPGRIMGAEIGKDAFRLANRFFSSSSRGSTRATFSVSKEFTDGNNPAEVDVQLDCSSGLILDQVKSISEDQGVEFIAQSFDDGTLTCSISETDESAAGYEATYLATGPSAVSSEGGCYFDEIFDGDENACHITNTPLPVEINVYKDWVFEGSNAPDINTFIVIEIGCSSEIVEINCPVPGPASNNTPFEGPAGKNGYPYYEICLGETGLNDVGFLARVKPDYPDTECTVTEYVFDAAVEVNNGCGTFNVSVGNGHDCTITNTVFFEGIPALSSRGLAILALLMMGAGFAGFRRFSP
jgi:hypothetical protein